MHKFRMYSLVFFLGLTPALSTSWRQYDQRSLLMATDVDVSQDATNSGMRFESPVVKKKVEDHLYRRFWEVIFDAKDVLLSSTEISSGETVKVMLDLFKSVGPYEVKRIKDNSIRFLTYFRGDVNMIVCNGQNLLKTANHLDNRLMFYIGAGLPKLENSYFKENSKKLHSLMESHLNYAHSFHLANGARRKR